MTRSLVIGLDIGTSACKAVAVDRRGRIAGVAGGTYRLYSPRAGWVEQDVDEVWASAAGALRELTGRVDTRRIAGLCLSGAMHSLLPVDDAGAPLARATTWADSRAAGEAGPLQKARDAAETYRRTGCPPQALYHPARLRWLAKSRPQIMRRAALFVAIRDWVLWKLTGTWATDIGLASATGLLDIHRGQWDSLMLRRAGIGAERLPRLAEAQQITGAVMRAAARATGLIEGLPVMPGGSDGGLANLGAGAAAPGQCVISVGTSGAVRVLADQPRVDRAMRTWCYMLTRERWFCGGAINNGGLALQWVCDRFYTGEPAATRFERMIAEAARTRPGAEGLVMLPYFTGERCPYYDPTARAALHGLTLRHGRAHVARAALEAVAFCLADVWRVVLPRGASPASVCLTGGITRSRAWCQVVADVLGVALRCIAAADASAVGAALMGHWGLGNLPTLEAAAATGRGGFHLRPDARRHREYRRLHREFVALCGREGLGA